jgi:hypothetical protein
MSERGTRWDRSCSPWVAQRLASAIGPDGLILTYLEDIDVLRPGDLALDQTPSSLKRGSHPFPSTRPSVRRR